MLKVLAVVSCQPACAIVKYRSTRNDTHLKTLENSPVGATTKLSFDGDQEIKCWILESSSILRRDTNQYLLLRSYPSGLMGRLACTACG